MKLSGSELTIFWLLFACSIAICAHRYYSLMRLIKKGAGDLKVQWSWRRFLDTIRYVLGQTCNTQNIFQPGIKSAAVGHLFIFWGAIIITLNYAVFLFAGEGAGFALAIRTNFLSPLFLNLTDFVALVIMMALIAAWIRRTISRPRRLGPHFDAGMFTVVTIGGIGLFACYFFLEGLRYHLGISPFPTVISSKIFLFIFDHWSAAGNLGDVFDTVWWLQYAIILCFIVYAPYSHHQHPFFCPLNVLLQSTKPYGYIEAVDFDAHRKFGASEPKEFTKKQLLEGFACTHCGRCQLACPAFSTDKPLSPKVVVNEINRRLLGSRNKSNSNDRTDMANALDVMSCTTCGACSDVCPVSNRPLDMIIELRRGLVYEGQIDGGHQAALQETMKYGNPYSVVESSRDSIIDVLGFKKANVDEKYDVIWWVGCSGFFDETTQDILRSMLKVMTQAGLSVAALGSLEQCCGDFVRRVGDEGLFQKLAKENIATLKKFNFDKIVTHCPHGYNALKNDYPKMGGRFNVLHHSEMLQQLIEDNSISVGRGGENVIYHDPCYLGRHNSIYEAPRHVLKKIAKKQYEFELSYNNSFCCGAGGGLMFKHEESGQRIQDQRAMQALECGAKTIITACPFCYVMLDDSIKMQGSDIVVKDIAKLAEEVLVNKN